ncbi:MAG: ribonuclease P protein component [Candidatus Limnocylindria bacterium]
MPPLVMLRRKADFDALGRQGTARSNRLLVLRALRTDGSTTRVGLSTPRSLGGAVQRNRVRRRLRQVLREQIGALGSGWDLLVVARPEAASVSHDELREAVRSLVERSGIRG